jgi:TIR domain/SIR2-like domain
MVSNAPSGDGMNDLFWDGLLLQIEERRVVPVVGPDLLVVQTEQGAKPLYRWAAERLAEVLHVPTNDLRQGYSLNDVVCRHLRRQGDIGDIYIVLAKVMREAKFPVPEALQQLAGITDFNLYVTTTFDSLLGQALASARPGIVPETIAYSPGKVPDLPAPKEDLTRPTVYQLFGRVAPSGGYAVSDEDVLEFVCKLQSTDYAPQKLFRALAGNHLLLLGCGFADWLDRFFLRTAKQKKLSEAREVREVVADRHTPNDENLVLFLEHFSRKTHIYRGDGPEEFVAELWRRWRARSSEDASKPAAVMNQRLAAIETEMPQAAIFISYNREDLEAVMRLYAGLKTAGLSVWFDKSEMKTGEAFLSVLRGNIEHCKFFIPVISTNTEKKVEGTFRWEWLRATERQEKMADDVRFILPVAIDGVVEPGKRVPELFKRLHWTSLPGGEVTPEFVDELTRLERDG